MAAYFAICVGVGWAAGQVIGAIAGAMCTAALLFGPPMLVFALIYAAIQKCKRPRPPTTVVLEEILRGAKAPPRALPGSEPPTHSQ